MTGHLISIGGLSGSGKSTLAKLLCETIPNSTTVQSDLVRKELLGVAPTTRLSSKAYSYEITFSVIKEIDKRVLTSLRQGMTVVNDGTYMLPKSRRHQERLATTAGARFTGLWLDVPIDDLIARVKVRKIENTDTSDAGVNIVHQQLGYYRDILMNWNRIDGTLGAQEVLTKAMDVINASR